MYDHSKGQNTKIFITVPQLQADSGHKAVLQQLDDYGVDWKWLKSKKLSYIQKHYAKLNSVVQEKTEALMNNLFV